MLYVSVVGREFNEFVHFVSLLYSCSPFCYFVFSVRALTTINAHRYIYIYAKHTLNGTRCPKISSPMKMQQNALYFIIAICCVEICVC